MEYRKVNTINDPRQEIQKAVEKIDMRKLHSESYRCFPTKNVLCEDQLIVDGHC